MFYFTTETVNYKSYRSKWFNIRLSSNGSDPQHVVVKVMNTKKPTAEIRCEVGSFSESQGVGFSHGKFVRTNDPELVAMCRAALTDDSAIAGLIDMVNEKAEGLKYAGSVVIRLLNRWWVLAQQESPSAFIDAERKQAAFDDKKFSVGERVIYWSRHGLGSQEVTITSEEFDWHPYFGGGWRYSCSAAGRVPQLQFRKIEQERTV